MSPNLIETEYRSDSASVFARIRDLPYCVFLDSGHGSAFAGRFDILAADPYVVLTTRGMTTEVRSRDRVFASDRDPLQLVADELGPFESGPEGLPFAGGAIGYLAYDLGRRFETINNQPLTGSAMPEMIVGLYDWALVVDHKEKRSVLVFMGRDRETQQKQAELIQRIGDMEPRPRPVFEVVSAVSSNFDRSSYGAAFDRIQEHIRQGDCYQVNLAQRFEAKVRGDSWDAYLTLRQLNPAPFAAYFSTPNGDILSSSPERFLRLTGDRVETKPIKGTRRRDSDENADAMRRQELAASVKDRAENIMIVDLLRNDLGKSCVPGSIEASNVFDIESFAHVHHLVSTVTGRLAPGCHPLDLVRGCFPGGSITGAPKVRAMQIIDELEPHRRSVYCGSIGYLGFNGQMDTNIAIRTLLRSGDSVYAWAGGGIVADSDADLEYQECFDKASSLLAVLAESRISAAG